MKTLRRVHLWAGVAVALFLLLQSVTGLILSNTRPAGQGPPWARPEFVTSTDSSGQEPFPQVAGPGFQGRRGFFEGSAGETNPTWATARELHEGRIGNYDFSLLLDIAAFGFILVTVTGLILAYKVLRGPGRKSTPKALVATGTPELREETKVAPVGEEHGSSPTGEASADPTHPPKEEEGSE